MLLLLMIKNCTERMVKLQVWKIEVFIFTDIFDYEICFTAIFALFLVNMDFFYL